MSALPPPPEGLVVPVELVSELEAAYARPPRHYHTFEHALAVARTVLDLHEAVGFAFPREAYLAALFHDAVYDAGTRDNEAKSARLAEEAIARHGMAADAQRVARLVERTASHGRLEPGELDADEALFLDADLAILAAEPATFDAYERGVQAEYRLAVPLPVYRLGRRRFLAGMLEKPRLFLSDHGHATWDPAARRNLRRALGRES